MKKTIAILLLQLIWLAVLSAQPADPCLEYLRQPTTEGYRAARGHLDSLLSQNSNDRQALLFSAYIDQAHLVQQIDRLYELRDSLENRQLFGLGNLLLETGEFHQAIEIYERLNAQLPQWSCPWRHKGQALYRLGRLAEAERSLLKAVETRASHYDAWVWLARVQKDLGRRREALISIKKAFQNKGRDTENPEKETMAGEGLALLDEILKLNGVPSGKIASERQKIVSSGYTTEEKKK